MAKKGQPRTIEGCERKHTKSKKALNACIKALGGESGNSRGGKSYAATKADTDKMKRNACAKIDKDMKVKIADLELAKVVACGSPQQIEAARKERLKTLTELREAEKKKQELLRKVAEKRGIRRGDAGYRAILDAKLAERKARQEQARIAKEAAAAVEKEKEGIRKFWASVGSSPPVNGFGSFNLRTSKR